MKKYRYALSTRGDFLYRYRDARDGGELWCGSRWIPSSSSFPVSKRLKVGWNKLSEKTARAGWPEAFRP